MTLSSLIRKGGLARIATATPATDATEGAAATAGVAEVATVAVAARPLPTMTAEQEAAVRAWLAHIEETNPCIIDDVLNGCRTDPDVLAYFALRALGIPQTRSDTDERWRCLPEDWR